MGILIALIPALGWGLQPLILGKLGGKTSNEVLGTGIGALIVGLLIKLFFSPAAISWPIFLVSMASGAFWILGQSGQYRSLEIMGVSKTMPITTGLQLVGTSIISVLAFGEWPGVTNKIFGAVAIVLLIIGASMTSFSESKGGNNQLKQGISILALTSFGYWIYSVIPKAIDASGLAIFFPQMLGIFAGAVVYTLIKEPKAFTEKKSWQTSIVGVIFSIGALAYIFSAEENGVATAYIITQLNVIVATLGSIVFLKEKKTPKELRLTLAGLALIVGGSIITVFL